MKRYLLSLALLCLVATGAHAYWQSRAQVAIVTGGGATTTWNPADKNASITLSNGDLTATDTVTGGFQALRAIASHSSGKYYFEIHVDQGTSTFINGIGNSTASLVSFVGGDNNSIGWNFIDGKIWLNGANPVTAIQTAVTGDTISIAVDMGNTNIWFRTNAGNWNNNAGNNPATNTGGISFATMAAGPWFPIGNMSATSNAGTADFGATGYANAAPSGFGNW